MRIEEHPIVDYGEHELVTFTMDGKTLTGYAGEPIASALIANGIQTFRHTHRNHEPRSLFCGIGQCTDCVCVVDGIPNVRTCITPLREGMCVETQEGHGKAGAAL